MFLLYHSTRTDRLSRILEVKHFHPLKAEIVSDTIFVIKIVKHHLWKERTNVAIEWKS